MTNKKCICFIVLQRQTNTILALHLSEMIFTVLEHFVLRTVASCLLISYKSGILCVHMCSLIVLTVCVCSTHMYLSCV